MRVLILVISIIFLSFTMAFSAAFTVSWSISSSPDTLGYKLYYGVSSGVYTTVLDVGAVISVVVDDLNTDQTYYFAVSAYDYFGNESVKSTEVRAVTTRNRLSLNMGL